MIRKSHICLVWAGLAVAVLPASGQEAVLQLPDRNPARATPTVKTAEAPLPDRNPDANDEARRQAPDVPSPDRNPDFGKTSESPAAPQRNPVGTPDRVLPWERNSTSADPQEAAPAPERNPAAAEIPEVAPAPERAPQPTMMPEDATADTVTPEDATADTAAPEGETVVTAPEDAPLPDRKPPPGDRPTVAWKNPKVVAARERCATLLEGRAIEYETLQPIRRGACGAPAPILVKSVGADPPVRIEPPATIRCPLAAALETWFQDQVQPAAMSAFGSPVVEIRNISSYKCRNRYNASNTKISEHAFANALDISGFKLATGERITVLKGWPRTVSRLRPPPPPTRKPDPNAVLGLTRVKAEPGASLAPPPEATPPPHGDKSAFLRLIHKDGCKTFNTVLGPAANAAHRNHFHFDMKVRRYVKICQ